VLGEREFNLVRPGGLGDVRLKLCMSIERAVNLPRLFAERLGDDEVCQEPDELRASHPLAGHLAYLGTERRAQSHRSVNRNVLPFQMLQALREAED
jgi:hypothetical protein